MYTFQCSQRTIDIEDPRKWNQLCGDEFSEILCEDKNYARWLSEENIKKMSGFDIATVLSVHPSLLWTFHDKIMTTKCMKPNDWDFLLKYQPQFIFLKNLKNGK